jgi:general nucleoside transport system ATP-binding protein
MRNITKRYPGVVANHDVSLEVAAGTIHGLLGENGAGKSTLVRILFGLVHPDAGTIDVHGERAEFANAGDALAAGIGMVQQHFSLIDDFTVAENLVLGREPVDHGRLNLGRAEAEIRDLSDRYHFRIDPTQRVADLSVGARQRVEIIKALYRGAQILVLDEPTAALAPQEVEELMGVLARLRDQSSTVILISHKLAEVVSICDRVTVLRDGAVVGHREISDAEREMGASRSDLVHELARMMVGRDLPQPPVRDTSPGRPVLVLQGVTDGDHLEPVDLVVHAGEIVGIAGVEGNGQAELVELVLGVRKARGGRVILDARDVTRCSVEARLRSGLAHIAEDRHGAGVAEAMDLTHNAALGFHNTPPLARGHTWLSMRRSREFAASIVARFQVRAVNLSHPLSSLSGGNQQKLVVGREFTRHPSVMVAAQPTRGLDVGAAAFVHEELAELRRGGSGVLLVSLDLSEILELADRIVVLCAGRIAGQARPGEVDTSILGAWMTGGATAVLSVGTGLTV